MGPLSAIVIAAGFAITGATTGKWITMSATLYAWLMVIFAIIIILDAFYFGTGTRYAAHWGRRSNNDGTVSVARGPVQQ